MMKALTKTTQTLFNQADKLTFKFLDHQLLQKLKRIEMLHNLTSTIQQNLGYPAPHPILSAIIILAYTFIIISSSKQES